MAASCSAAEAKGLSAGLAVGPGGGVWAAAAEASTAKAVAAMKVLSMRIPDSLRP
jgi:hypothetical protein